MIVNSEMQDDLTTALALLEQKLAPRVVKKALVDLAKPLVSDMKAAAPHRTGALRRAIGHRSTIDYKQQTTRVKAGLIYRQSNRKGWVAGLMQERGTRYLNAQPFIHPVADQHLPTLVQQMNDFIRDRLDSL